MYKFRVRANEHRSRRDSPSPDPDPDCLSSFYRQRFGSHSPEDYLNLRLSQFDKSLSKEDIKSILEREFRHLAPFEVFIFLNMGEGGCPPATVITNTPLVQ